MSLITTSWRLFKHAAMYSFAGLGLDRAAARSRWRSERLLILGYHGISVANEHEWDPSLFMCQSTFRRRMQGLRESGASVLPLDEALQRLRAGNLPPMAVSITFDDGFVDFAKLALPILEEFRFPATLYLTSWYCEHRRPIMALMLGFLLWRARARGTITFPSTILDGLAIRVATHADRTQSLQRMMSSVYAILDTEERFHLAERIARVLEPSYDRLLALRALQLLSTEEVRALPPSLVDVQMHTHRHRTPIDKVLFQREIEDNRAFIEEARAAVPRHFCYPNGRYNALHLPWLREYGVESATIVEAALASRFDEPLLLPRLMDQERLSQREFRAWTSGWWPRVAEKLQPPNARMLGQRRVRLAK